MSDSLWHSNVKHDPEFRRRMFETLVMHALWILIRCAWGARPYVEAMSLRTSMIDYGDALDPSDDPKRRAFRRETHYAPLPAKLNEVRAVQTWGERNFPRTITSWHRMCRAWRDLISACREYASKTKKG